MSEPIDFSSNPIDVLLDLYKRGGGDPSELDLPYLEELRRYAEAHERTGEQADTTIRARLNDMLTLRERYGIFVSGIACCVSENVEHAPGCRLAALLAQPSGVWLPGLPTEDGVWWIRDGDGRPVLVEALEVGDGQRYYSTLRGAPYIVRKGAEQDAPKHAPTDPWHYSLPVTPPEAD